MTTIAGRTVEEWIAAFPLIAEMQALHELEWFNEAVQPSAQGLSHVGLAAADIADAAARLNRFAPYMERVFPDARRTGGILESPLVATRAMQDLLGEVEGVPIPGKLWAKLDSHLPISGSIKARGGIHEVLQHAERLALDAGKLHIDDDYSALDSDEMRAFFGQYKVAVGSTGNLGLSIGIMSAKLGFQASVHMSADARQWKKDQLREHGVTVVEYDSDYSIAVAQGREEAESDPMAYFVDDENSVSLFLGYAVSGRRLAGQFQALDIAVDDEHPLLVYLPCGVGGGPGGVAFGIKSVFGDAAHCIFAEPTHSPCMLLGVHTGAHEALAVQDFGIDNRTAADGLAVGRPSGFVGSRMQYLVDGYYTVDDDAMFRLLAQLDETEDLRIEPSSATAFTGPHRVLRNPDYLERAGLTAERLANATHLAWVTGGSMVPRDEMQGYVDRGRMLLERR